jgi:hypothetical protein
MAEFDDLPQYSGTDDWYIDTETGLIDHIPGPTKKICHGGVLPKDQYPKLYEIFQQAGQDFGQDELTFKVPDLQARVRREEMTFDWYEVKAWPTPIEDWQMPHD